MESIITVSALTVLMFFYFRWFFWNVTDFMLNKKSRKRKKDGQTFREWLLYSRYRDAIPKSWLSIYFIFMGIHLIDLAVIIVCNIFSISYITSLIEMSVKIIIWGDIVLLIIFEIAFRGRKNGITYVDVGRWIKKGKKK